MGSGQSDGDPAGLIQRFAAENNLDLGALSGDPLRSGLRDQYRILASTVPDASAPLLGQITALQIREPMRFGNSLIQLSNAIELAASLPIRRIFAPGFWWVAPQADGDGALLKVIPGPAPPGENVLDGMFYYRHSLRALYRREGKSVDVFRANLRRVGQQIPLLQARAPLPDDHLVIHIRSGDVFRGVGHPLYGQPPLSFYTLILRAAPWRQATIVCEDRLNPVVDALLAAGGNGLPPVAYRPADLAGDLDLLLRATSLAGSLGTFVPAVLALSANVRRVFCFERLWYGQDVHQRLDMLVAKDVTGDYSRSIMARNWRNSGEQRALMLAYPERHLRLVQVPRAAPGPASGRRLSPAP